MAILKFKNIQGMVDICYNGEDAYNLMEKAIKENCHDRYSLILTDCNMPFMDGYEESKRIRVIRKQYRLN